jgi:hydroxypyruvate reductase
MSIYSALRRVVSEPDLPVSLPEQDRRGHEAMTGQEAKLRRDAESVLQQAVAAVDPRKLAHDALAARAERIEQVKGRVHLAAFGKAAAAMAQGARSALGYKVRHGVLIVPADCADEVPAGFETFRGGHPVPDQGSVAGSQAIRQMAEELGEDDMLLCLISGGGSSLLTIPPAGMPLEDVQEVTRLLLESGAPIEDVNCVRRHLDELKGGRLARAARPAEVLGIVISDVVGDPLEAIASGPISPDPSTFADAVSLLKRHRVWKRVPLAARGYLDRGISREIQDSPTRIDPCFEKARAIVAGNAHTAAEAACREAERLGYESQLLTTTLTGEARKAGQFLAETLRTLRGSIAERKPTCIVTAGETTVKVRGEGKGGRNQELALSAALKLDGLESVLLASMGTDGIDGPTEAAGAVITGTTARRAREAGHDPAAALGRNDAYTVLRAVDDLIVSGPTGTNVADIQVMLIT